MVYIRGHALDYDNWEDMGAEGWNYQNCLPYFKKAQTHELGEGEYRGGSGKKIYRISAYSFRGNYSFLKVENVEIFI